MAAAADFRAGFLVVDFEAVGLPAVVELAEDRVAAVAGLQVALTVLEEAFRRAVVREQEWALGPGVGRLERPRRLGRGRKVHRCRRRSFLTRGRASGLGEESLGKVVRRWCTNCCVCRRHSLCRAVARGRECRKAFWFRCR